MKPWRTLVLTSLTSVALLVPTQAYAGSYLVHDSTKDVISQTDDGAETKAPDHTEGDVRSSYVEYAPRRVVAAMSYVGLTQTPDLAGHVFSFHTNKGRVRDVTVLAGPGHWAGRAEMTTGRGRHVRCRVARTIDYTQHRISISVPRSCLGKPRWVQVGMGMVTVKGNTFFGDDALTNGTLGNNVVLGPRVFRG